MNKLLTMLYVLANGADFGFTVWGISLTSVEVEVNPIAHSILVNHGISGLFVFKFGGMVFALAVIAVLIRMVRNEPRMRYIAPAIFLYGIVVSLIGVWSWIPVLTFVLFMV